MALSTYGPGLDLLLERPLLGLPARELLRAGGHDGGGVLVGRLVLRSDRQAPVRLQDHELLLELIEGAEAALAISCLANIVTPELSQTLVADVYSLLNNHKPDLRRRACLCLYKCFLRYPEALRPSFARLTECLEDDDQTVVQAAVTVLSELAMHNPKTYLPLAPKFYKLLTTSSSNWMTIKICMYFQNATSFYLVKTSSF